MTPTAQPDEDPAPARLDGERRQDPAAGLAAFWSEPVRGGHPDPHLFSLPGIEQLRGQMAGESPEAPLSRLTGMRLAEIADGEAEFTMPLTGWLAGADGLIPPGPLAIPADAAMACAIMSRLPAGMPFTTSEMTLRALRPVGPGGQLRARGRVIAAGPPAALAEVAVHDDAGTLIAHGSSLCMILPRLSAPPARDPEPEASHEATHDPWQRPAPAAPGVLPGVSWLDQLGAQLDGQRPPAPLERFTGLAPRNAGLGEAGYTLAASPWFCAPPPGRVQGGVIMMLAEAAIFGAVRTPLLADHPFHPVELKINLLRPLASDGRLANAHGQLVHSGRRVAVGRGEVHDASGRSIAVATGSALLGEAVVGER